LKWLKNLQKHLEKIEPFSTSTFGTSNFGQVHYVLKVVTATDRPTRPIRLLSIR
jgi:hypothetical protein